MKKHRLNFAVDLVTLLLMLAMVATGLIIRYVLPPGSGGHDGGPALSVWGLSRHGWGAVHFWLAVAVAVVLLLHVALHWAWVCGVVRRWVVGSEAQGRKQPRDVRVAYGVALIGTLTVMVAGFVWLANRSVERTPGRAVDKHWASVLHEPGDGDIHGRTTLAEMAEKSGIRVETLKVLLHLPGETSADERLGRLARKYGFAVSDARRLVLERASRVSSRPHE